MRVLLTIEESQLDDLKPHLSEKQIADAERQILREREEAELRKDTTLCVHCLKNKKEYGDVCHPCDTYLSM